MPPRHWFCDRRGSAIAKDLLELPMADGCRLGDLDYGEWDRLDPASLPPYTASRLSMACRELLECAFGGFWSAWSSGWPDEPQHTQHLVHGDVLTMQLGKEFEGVTWETTWTVRLRWARRTRSGQTAHPLPGMQVRCWLSQQPLDETWLEKSRLPLKALDDIRVRDLMYRSRDVFYRKLRGSRLLQSLP